MSMTARHEDRKARQMCERCRDRKARFQYRGHVKVDRDHPPSLSELRRASTLCFECYRSERERQRAHRLFAIDPPMLRSPFGVRSALTGREIAHRRRMLEHLADEAATATASDLTWPSVR
jgi:hypothetical protein